LPLDPLKSFAVEGHPKGAVVNRRVWIVLFLLVLTSINYIDRIILFLAAKPIIYEFHLSPVQLGYLFSCYLWTYVFFQIPAGMLVDQVGPKRVIGWEVALWSIATVLTGMAWSLQSLGLRCLIMGIGEATPNPGGARVIREWFPARERGVVNSIFNGGSYAGPAVCALVFMLAAVIYFHFCLRL
jgi:MFS family permease